jgi:hypothetical protein
VFSLAACGDTGGVGPSGVPDVAGDVGDAGAQSDVPVIVEPDAGADDGSTLPPNVGDDCERDEDCRPGPCIRVDAELAGQCSTRCFDDDDCPDEWACLFVTSSGQDGDRVCVPTRFCRDLDGDGFGVGPGCAGGDCADDDPDSFLGATETCNGLDDDCDGAVDESVEGMGTPCNTLQMGACADGRLECRAGAPTCAPIAQASVELCNGVDDDCDGDIDEDDDGQPLRATCYEGDPLTIDVGRCTAGVRTCRDAAYGRCEGMQLPSGVELCNGLDDDCDGATDEESIEQGVACNTGQPGVCAVGTTECRDAAPRCVATLSPVAELCNGLDDDCDGIADDGIGGLAEPCIVGTGECRAVGITVCDAENPAGPPVCTTDAGTPVAELCNGLDDDCDGSTDEGFEPLGRVCRLGVGECAAVGVWQCNPDRPAGSVVCSASTGAPTSELCNGLDDDCDGQPDNGFTQLGEPCTTGLGICNRPGRFVCSDDETAAPLCNAVPAAPQTEVCNGFDDNCDGSIDNLPEAPLCPLQLGVCAGARQICTGSGGFLTCSTVNYGIRYEAVEVSCDGFDNDCDGEVDNVDVDRDGEVAAACGGLDCDDRSPLVGTGFEEICGDGVDNDCDGVAENRDSDDDSYIAVACGGTDCNDASAAVYPGNTETCGDRLDNDCDGSIDNRDDDGDSFLAVACGGTDCDDDDDRRFPGNPEVCDLVDNDCNTLVDDKDADADTYRDVACGGTDCRDNDPLVNPGVAEVCGDSIDNDCSGVSNDRDVDRDGFRDVACGGTDCGDDSALIFPGATEVRDARDGDCDGTVDEGLVPPGQLIVTEFMKDPTVVTDTAGEWFEVYNTSSQPINLDSWVLSDLSTPVAERWVFRITGGLVVLPDEYVVLCRTPDVAINGGVPCDAGYDDFQLANTEDELILSLAGVEIDRVVYLSSGGWPSTAGRSIALRPGSLTGSANDVGSSWCATPSTLANRLPGGDYGTPGRANSCP